MTTPKWTPERVKDELPDVQYRYQDGIVFGVATVIPSYPIEGTFEGSRFNTIPCLYPHPLPTNAIGFACGTWETLAQKLNQGHPVVLKA